MKFDLLIVAHEKDFCNLKYVVSYADKNINYESLHLIVSEREDFDETTLLECTNKPIFKHKESDILKVDKTKINYRPNWIYQQLLKLFQNVTLENYLVLDADCLILKPLNIDLSNVTTFYLGRDQYNQPYFNFMSKVFGFGKLYPNTFISEFMIMNRNVIKELLNSINCKDVEDFLEICYSNMDNYHHLSEFELYGNFYFKKYPQKFAMKPLNVGWTGKGESYSDDEIQDLIKQNNDKDALSFHHWI